MPLLDSRYEHVKVWRPSGTPYAEAKRQYVLPADQANSAETLIIGLAVEGAVRNFRTEFGRIPVRQRMVIEVISSGQSVIATVYELPEDTT